jgi:hypothetical protein
MAFSFPDNKVLNLRKECGSLVSSYFVSLSSLAHMIGNLTEAKAAVFLVPLHYRALRHQRNILENRGIPLRQKARLDHKSIADLKWWSQNLIISNSRPIKLLLPNLVKTRGTWSLQETSLHINCLELLGASRAITKGQHNIHVLVKLDNTTASLCKQDEGAKYGPLDEHDHILWEWKITLRAGHIPGHLNIIADAESRTKPDPADWKLDREVFRALNLKFDPFTIDLFANRNNKQLQRYWKLDREVFRALNLKFDPFTIDLFANRNNKQLQMCYSYLPDPEAKQFDALIQP